MITKIALTFIRFIITELFLKFFPFTNKLPITKYIHAHFESIGVQGKSNSWLDH